MVNESEEKGISSWVFEPRATVIVVSSILLMLGTQWFFTATNTRKEFWGSEMGFIFIVYFPALVTAILPKNLWAKSFFLLVGNILVYLIGVNVVIMD